jgi:ribosomal protein S12 methylthiotransferase
LTPSAEDAEIIIVNTCGFIESAKQESIDAILEMARQKSLGSCRRLVVAGCLVERYRSEIHRRIPEVDAVVGVNEVPDLLKALEDRRGEIGSQGPPPPYLYSHADPRVLTTPPFTAYIKISEGCDHPCAFCAIPQMRGRFRSRAFESVLREARDLAARGVKEVNLIGQDTTMYGADLGLRHGLADLVRRLAEIDGVEWVRFLYAYPNSLDQELLRAMAETPKVCKYLDLPLQHVSGRVLKAMKRGGNRGSLSRLVQRVRRTVPAVAIRTTMIVGFPGETDEEFAELLDFVQETEFDRLGVFTYSDEEGTLAFNLDQKVPARTKQNRMKSLLQLQKRISKRRNRALVGGTFPVLVEGVSPESDMLWQGRLPTQAPEIDGVVYLNDGIDDSVRPGDIRLVRISEAHEYDLVGEVLPSVAPDCGMVLDRFRAVR